MLLAPSRGDSGVSETDGSFGNPDACGVFGAEEGGCVAGGVDSLVGSGGVVRSAACPAGGVEVPSAGGLVGALALGSLLPLSSDGAVSSSLALLGPWGEAAMPEAPGVS